MQKLNNDINDIAKGIILKLSIEGLSITPLKLQKLLYYTQAWFLAFTDKLIFPDNPQAWVNGPVYPEIFRQYKGKSFDPIIIEKDLDELLEDYKNVINKIGLDDEELKLFEKIIMAYGAKSAAYLVNLTHNEKPWIEARGDLSPFVNSNNLISFETIKEYYQSKLERKQN